MNTLPPGVVWVISLTATSRKGERNKEREREREKERGREIERQRDREIISSFRNTAKA